MKLRLIQGGSFAALALATALPAAAAPNGDRVDTAHFSVQNMRSFAIGTAGSQQKLAQTLTVEFGGRVQGVFVPVTCGSGRMTVDLVDVVKDLPGTTILASQTIRADRFPGLFGKFSFVKLPGDLPVYSGDRLAIVITNAKGDCAWYASADPGTYGGGKGYFEALPNPPGWLPFSDFPGDPDDLPFQLVVTPF